jgi:hypothetical protein
MTQKKARIHKVKCSEVPWWIRDIGDTTISVGNVLGRRLCLDNFELGLVHVETDYPPGGTHTSCQFTGDVAATTSNIEAPHTGAKAHLVQEIIRLRLENMAEYSKSFAT